MTKEPNTSEFVGALEEKGGRLWIHSASKPCSFSGHAFRPRVFYLAYDQLSMRFAALSELIWDELSVVLVESTWKPRQRAYHKQKLVMLLSNQRHFALELCAHGIDTHYIVTDQPYEDIAQKLLRDTGRLEVIGAAEYELRAALVELCDDERFVVHPNDAWLSTENDFLKSQPDKPPYRMDSFYRLMRKKTGILMETGKPVGGKLSHDHENRKAWKGSPPAPVFPTFVVSPITAEVCAMVEERFAHHPGKIQADTFPASTDDILRFWNFVKTACLPLFGPYEDAMHSNADVLFHTKISMLLNLCRLWPRQIVDDVCTLNIPINSKEGFVRQILGWREFVYHIHHKTDGFRTLKPAKNARVVADGVVKDGKAQVSYLETSQNLPMAYWGTNSGMRCLDHVVDGVVKTGYSHHITRLMVLSNIANLLDVEPRQVTDWFWEMYVDAFDWVVEPNVLGMGVFALGEMFTTKPYICGQSYIKKMSNYCNSCSFKDCCPVTPMYWAFLGRHEDKLFDNARLRMPYHGLNKRSSEKKSSDREVFIYARKRLDTQRPLEAEKLFMILSD